MYYGFRVDIFPSGDEVRRRIKYEFREKIRLTNYDVETLYTVLVLRKVVAILNTHRTASLAPFHFESYYTHLIQFLRLYLYLYTAHTYSIMLFCTTTQEYEYLDTTR